MFKISTRTRYGLRALLELAARGIEKPITLKEIAEKQNLSVKYLENIFKLLKNNDIVRSTRGPGGGYQLSRPAAGLNLLHIITAIEGPLATTDCVIDEEVCTKTEACRVRRFWGGLQNHISHFLQAHSLEDILLEKNQEELWNTN